MITKFFSKPTRTRASAKNTIKYLCGSLDGEVTREGAKLLKGDILLSLALAESVIRKNQFTVGCLSFKEEQIDEHKKHEIMADFERTALAGLNEDDYNILWIEHTDKDRLELNFFIPRMELSTGNDLQPYFDKVDQPKLDLWKDCINIEYQLHAPQDEPRATAFIPAKWRESKNGYVLNVVETREQIYEYFKEKILAGTVKNRADIIQYLDDMGLNPRPSKDYITITPPPYQDPEGNTAIDPKTNQPYKVKNVRLKGGIYGEQSEEFISASGTKASGKYHERNKDNLADFRRELGKIISRDAERNRERYDLDYRKSKREAKREAERVVQGNDRQLERADRQHAEPAPTPAEITAGQLAKSSIRDRADQPTHSDIENTGGAGDLYPIRPSRHQSQSAENSGANPPISPANEQGEKRDHVHGWHSWLDGAGDRVNDMASGATIRSAGDRQGGVGEVWRTITNDSDHERASEVDRSAEKRDPSPNPADPASTANTGTDPSPARATAPAGAGAFTPSGRAEQGIIGTAESTAGSTSGAGTQASGTTGGSTAQGGATTQGSGSGTPAPMPRESEQQIFVQIGAENEQANISIFDKVRHAFTGRISRVINSVRDITERTRKLIKSLSTSEEQQREWQEISAGAIRDNKEANGYNQRLRASTSELEQATAHTSKRRTAINALAGSISQHDHDTERTNQIIDKYSRIAEQRTSARLARTTNEDRKALASEDRQEASRDRRLAGTTGDSDQVAEYLQRRAGERATDQDTIQRSEQHIERTKHEIISTDSDIEKSKQRTGEQSQYIDWINNKIQSHVQRLEAEKRAEQQREAERLERIRLAEIKAEKVKKSEQNNDYSSPSPFD